MQNGLIERFNRLYREAVLDAYLCFELYEVRQLTKEWMEEYNLRRPHETLGNLSPLAYKTRLKKRKNISQLLSDFWRTFRSLFQQI